MIINRKQREIPDCTKGKTEPQHGHLSYLGGMPLNMVAADINSQIPRLFRDTNKIL